MHLPAWKPDLIILNSGGSGTYKQRAGDSGAAGGRGGSGGAGGGEEEGGRGGLSHCMDVWCENSICSSPVIVTQFPVSHTHAHAQAWLTTTAPPVIGGSELPRGVQVINVDQGRCSPDLRWEGSESDLADVRNGDER